MLRAQAQALQAERHHAPEAAQEARQRTVPEPCAETRAGQERAAPAPEKRPLGETAAQINAAWTETHNPSDNLAASAAAFRQAIENRGPILVYVSADEAQASSRAKSFATAIDRQNRALREGFAVVDARGTVNRKVRRVGTVRRFKADRQCNEPVQPGRESSKCFPRSVNSA